MSVKGIRRIIVRVSTFRVIVLYPLSAVAQMKTMYTKAALVWFCSFEVKMTRIYMCKRRQREMAIERTEKLILQVEF